MSPPIVRPTSGVRQILAAFLRLCRSRELAVVLVCCVVLGFASSFVLPFASMFGTLEVKMTLRTFGAFMTCNAVAGIVISTVLSRRSDSHYSRRALLLLSSAACVVGYLGYAFVRDVWLLLGLGSLVLGVGSVTFSQLFAHARELLGRSQIPPGDAPLYMNTFRMSFALAWTVGPALAAGTLRVFSFRGLYCTAASLFLLFFLIVFLFVPARPPESVTTAAPDVSYAELLRTPGVVGWFLAFVLVFAAHIISFSNMSLFVLKVLGGSEGNVGTIFSLAPLFELPFMLYFGLLATRIGSTALIRVSFALAIVYYGALSCVRAPWHIYPLQFLSAAIVAVNGGIAITFFQNKLPGRLGTATNLYSTAQRVGTTAGYLAFGAVSSSFGHRGAYVACTALVSGAFLLSLLLDRGARVLSAS